MSISDQWKEYKSIAEKQTYKPVRLSIGNGHTVEYLRDEKGKEIAAHFDSRNSFNGIQKLER